jgi:site-specific recombinase XerD
VQTLLRAAGQSGRGLARRNYALIQVMLQAGLRVGEVATLTCADLELHDRSGQVRVHGKGAKERVVPLNTTARRALHAYFKDRAPLSGKTPVFLSESGAALSVRSMQALIANLARRAKIAHAVSAHTCRHTFALNFLKQHPGELVELAVLLGHDSVETTAVYTQPSAEEMADDLERSTGDRPRRRRRRLEAEKRRVRILAAELQPVAQADLDRARHRIALRDITGAAVRPGQRLRPAVVGRNAVA